MIIQSYAGNRFRQKDKELLDICRYKEISFVEIFLEKNDIRKGIIKKIMIKMDEENQIEVWNFLKSLLEKG